MTTSTWTRLFSVAPTTKSSAAPVGIGRLFSLWRSRRALNRLDDAALRDVGLSRADAEREARRVAWDVPQNWRN